MLAFVAIAALLAVHGPDAFGVAAGLLVAAVGLAAREPRHLAFAARCCARRRCATRAGGAGIALSAWCHVALGGPRSRRRRSSSSGRSTPTSWSSVDAACRGRARRSPAAPSRATAAARAPTRRSPPRAPGARVAMVGAVGADDLGDEALRELAAEGIDVAAVARLDDVATGVAVIVVDERGREPDRRRLRRQRASSTATMVEEALRAAAQARHDGVVLLGHEVPEAAVVAGVRAAARPAGTSSSTRRPRAALPDDARRRRPHARTPTRRAR